MSTRKGKREGLRFADMTPADILVMADKVKEQGLGLSMTSSGRRGQGSRLPRVPGVPSLHAAQRGANGDP